MVAASPSVHCSVALWRTSLGVPRFLCPLGPSPGTVGTALGLGHPLTILALPAALWSPPAARPLAARPPSSHPAWSIRFFFLRISEFQGSSGTTVNGTRFLAHLPNQGSPCLGLGAFSHLAARSHSISSRLSGPPTMGSDGTAERQNPYHLQPGRLQRTAKQTRGCTVIVTATVQPGWQRHMQQLIHSPFVPTWL